MNKKQYFCSAKNMDDLSSMELNSNLRALEKEWKNYYAIKERREMTPPIFFHEKAIECCNNEDFLGKSHIEYIYAMLVSWGMHRAGKKGAKMPPYEIFRESILRCRGCIEELQKYRIESISAEELNMILPRLTCLCFSIHATTRSAKIVSSSKTLAHLLPNLVCPIDNRYTLTFFIDDIKGKSEQDIFQYIIKQMWRFYHNIDISYIKLGDTLAHSYPKVFDNLIIEYMQHNVYSKNIKQTKKQKSL